MTTLERMPNGFLQCVISSPPYWQKRDYFYPEQWGLEETPALYLEHLWEMMDLIYDKLKPDGSVWINLGDTYSTQSGTNLAASKGQKTEYSSTYMVNRGTSEKLVKPKLPAKNLLLIPHKFAIGCQERGWIVRNDIKWVKKNPMPEPVKDRFSTTCEYIFFMVKSQNYYFDLDSVRVPHKEVSKKRYSGTYNGKYSKDKSTGWSAKKADPNRQLNPKGKNCGDSWVLKTNNSRGTNHYASYPLELILKPLLAGSREGDIIYDPFAGTGSTAAICEKFNRNWIMSEWSKEYCDIINKRIENLLKQPELF